MSIHRASVGLAREPWFSQTFHSRSMLAWCSQKIGSRPAVVKLLIQPRGWRPPTSMWISPCGTFSRLPTDPPLWFQPVTGPPKPAKLGSPVGSEKYISAITAPMSTSSRSISSPPLMLGSLWLLSLTNSGLASPEGIWGSLKTRGSLRALGLRGSL